MDNQQDIVQFGLQPNCTMSCPFIHQSTPNNAVEKISFYFIRDEKFFWKIALPPIRVLNER